MFWRYLPLAGIIAIIAIAGFVRPVLQYARHGTSGFRLFRAGGFGQKLRDGLFVLMLAGFIAQALIGLRRPRWVRPLLAEDGAVFDVLQVVGATLIIGGIALFAAAQLNLGASWRIGIDETSKPGMVSSGLYRISRHPIFLGFLTVLTGFAAMMPTPLSLTLLLGGYIGFRTQAGTEEAYMLRAYGDPYRAYAQRVGRFLPGLGKL
jgi:protein-S-isoprenylcysteine O-methyltransferase Ste14